jgi:ferrous iron transport protein B
MKTRIALLGQPNSGKSTVYNALTGSRQHVGNWPGKTVEKNEGHYTYDGVKYTVTDLPGSYGLTGNSDEEVITADYIKSGNADLVCILADASQLETINEHGKKVHKK